MPNQFEQYGISQDDIDEALTSQAVIDAKVELANEAADYWRSVSPRDTDDYHDSIKVEQNGSDVSVGAYDPAANIIEYGNEKTPEFAPRAQTEAHFEARRKTSS
ncbi:Uncharacterised protein [Mycobacteroides abscessus subsp. bolletii]|uniref:hypothetical protein n=1 Tax=Mycobacteroides abscessus TaxID=36809 RepID=UPI0009293348|nr:hypothetical protein [Mycobacteroides abscessus]SIJ52495.1 Uncharacterised protein [Mycobacteroides abscessus subsp. bolletii]SLD45407.1 Uncharacterised protein [Mycobacteroides abscessus subsp. bolletii]SLE36466.1 Uncharacterised protein [Mycobacteroides abscessus subsp. bolletii]